MLRSYFKSAASTRSSISKNNFFLLSNLPWFTFQKLYIVISPVIELSYDSIYGIINLTSTEKDAEKPFGLYFHFNVYKELPVLKMKVFLDAKNRSTLKRLYILNQTINMCSILRDRTSNWQIKVIFGNLSKYPRLPKRCPVQPGEYFANNFTTDMTYLPFKTFPETQFTCKLEIFTVIQKRFISIAQINVNGLLKSNDL